MNSEEMIKENKMGVMPVNRLLVSMSFPMMISMMVQALYNIVDSIYVSRINESALTAVSLAFPIQSLMLAVGMGTGVGVNAVLSKSLGGKNYEKAGKAAANGVFLAGVSYMIFLIVGVTMVKVFYAGQTENASIMKYGSQYLTIVCCCSFGMYAQLIFEKLLQSTGRTLYTMITQTMGAVINIILDPILIFGWMGFPKMGVMGAAAATVCGQVTAAVLAFGINQKRNKEIRIPFRGFRPEKEIIGQIYAIGVPSIIMQAIGSVMTYGMNRILLIFTPTAVAVFGVYYKLQSFIFMPVFGLSNGAVPIISYNFGAGKRDRLIRTIQLGIMYAVTVMVIGFLIFQLFPQQLYLLFDASESMLQIGIPALRTISISFWFAGFCIICGSAFQALGNAVYGMMVSIARQLVVLLPAAYFLAGTGEVNNVWWAFPIAEIASLTMTVFFLIKINRKIIRHIGESR